MPVFVDTNVLIYALDARESIKQPIARAWRDHLWRTGAGRLSFQILNEFYATMTRKLSIGVAPAVAQAEVNEFLAWRPIPQTEATLRSAWSLQDRHSLSFWDALIVASAVEGGCERLLTEDLTDGQTYGRVTVVNPFRHPPS